MQVLSDNQLLDAIWANQLINTAVAPVKPYKGNQFMLVGESDRWFALGVWESRIQRRKVTDKISAKELLSRLRNLIQSSQLCTDTASAHSFMAFYIDSARARAAYKFSRQFWIRHGFNQETSKEISKKEFERLVKLCVDSLKIRFYNRETEDLKEKSLEFGNYLSEVLAENPELMKDLEEKGAIRRA